MGRVGHGHTTAQDSHCWVHWGAPWIHRAQIPTSQQDGCPPLGHGLLGTWISFRATIGHGVILIKATSKKLEPLYSDFKGYQPISLFTGQDITMAFLKQHLSQ